MTEFPDSLLPQEEETRWEYCDCCRMWFPYEEGAFLPEENTWICARCSSPW